MNYNKTFYELSAEEYDDMNIAEWYDTYKKYKKLEEEIGCPPEVRCKLYNGRKIYYQDGHIYKVMDIDLTSMDVDGITTLNMRHIPYSDYKKTFWLKEDKTE